MIDIDALRRDKRPQSAWVVHALIDRLEAAEKELAELRSSMKFRTSLIGRTEAERDALRAALQHEADCVEAAKAEIKALRAEIVRPLAERSDRLERALREVKEAVEHTPLGVRGIKALQAARAALEERRAEMTINIEELRRLAQEAMHPVTKGRWMRLFGERTVYDRMEDGCRGIPVVSTDKHPPSSFEAACLDFIAAANPAVINSLLERLEAAESDALEQARLNGMGSEREAALMAKLEAAEKERDALRIELNEIRYDAAHQKALAESALRVAEGWEGKCGELRAKIEAMEKQEPVATVIKEGDSRYWMSERLWTFPNGEYPLYALPGAQGEEEE